MSRDARFVTDWSQMPPCCRPWRWLAWLPLGVQVWKSYEAFATRPKPRTDSVWARARHQFATWLEPSQYYVCEFCGHAVFVGWAESHLIVDCPQGPA